MGDDIICIPAISLQAGPCGPILLLAGQRFFPPRAGVHPVQCSAVIKHSAFPFELRIIRFQDAAADIVAASAAHREEDLTLDIVDLSTQQVDHRGADMLNVFAMPVLRRILHQQIEIFVVLFYKQGSKGIHFRTVQPVLLFGASVPYAAEITCDDYAVIFGQLCLFMEDSFFGTGKISVGVTCDEYRYMLIPLLDFSTISKVYPKSRTIWGVR